MWVSSMLGLVPWVGAIVAVFISMTDIIGRSQCGSLHI